jgi:uncharacterized protein DUF3224
MTRATGSFDVLDGTDDPIAELDGGLKVTHASGAQRFSGDIAGDGAIDWLMLYRGDKTAHFVGLQRISGSVGGRRGTFVLAAEGDHDGSASRVTWTVVADSGTGELAGIHGSGEMVSPGKAGTYALDYEIDA